MNFVVLCSSNGTTFQAILDRIVDGSLTAKCIGLITDRQDRGCVKKAQKAGLPFRVVEKNEEESKEEYEKRLYEEIVSLEKQPFAPRYVPRVIPSDLSAVKIVSRDTRDTRGDTKGEQDDILIACMGWMHIFSSWFVQQFPNRILNVHPALLPKYGGKGMYGLYVHQEVLKNHEQESGMTIHIVTKDVDQGPVLLQKKCPVLPTDTPETLQKRVQDLEKEWYPKVLQMIEKAILTL